MKRAREEVWQSTSPPLVEPTHLELCTDERVGSGLLGHGLAAQALPLRCAPPFIDGAVEAKWDTLQAGESAARHMRPYPPLRHGNAPAPRM